MKCVGKTCCATKSSAACRKFVSIFRFLICWSWRRDLNPRPPDYKSGALPTELRQHIGDKYPSGHKYTL
jgi:hypothetical protein